MSAEQIRANIEAYVAAWNEGDETKRRGLLERSCAAAVVLRTGGRSVVGCDALGAMIADFQRRCPGQRAAFVGAIDVQGSLFRYAGAVEGSAGPAPTAFDAGACDAEGKIEILLTFVGADRPSSAS